MTKAKKPEIEPASGVPRRRERNQFRDRLLQTVGNAEIA